MSKDGGDPPKDDSKSDGPDKKKDDIYENRKNKQIIRIITVMAYMFAVSSMGMTLSGYYLFLWQPPNPKLISHVRNPLRQVADPPMVLSPPIPMALKSPVEEHVILTKLQKTNKTTSTSKPLTPKPPTYDFETFSRANLAGSIIFKKLSSSNLVLDQVSKTTKADVNNASSAVFNKSTSPTVISTSFEIQENKEDSIKSKTTILSKMLGESTTINIIVDKDDPNADGQFKRSTILNKVLTASPSSTIDEDKGGFSLRQ